MISLRAGYATDPGRKRTENQDRIVTIDGQLYGVADGMGGHRGGETAAQMVVDSLAESFANRNMAITTNALVERLRSLNSAVLNAAWVNDDLTGMGSTLTLVALRHESAPPTVLVANVGDSRTYLLRSGELQQLTDDHSVVADLVRQGSISADAAKSHPKRSWITRAIGAEPSLEPDIIEVLVSVGMRFLLCSDGLTNEVPDTAIGSILRRVADPDAAARELVRMAIEKGGRDNVSVVVVDVVDNDGDSVAREASGHVVPTALPHSNDASASIVRGEDLEPVTKAQAAPVRRPWPVNLRVLLFLAVLVALAIAVVTLVRNAPTIDTEPRGVVENTALITTPADVTPADVTPADVTPADAPPAEASDPTGVPQQTGLPTSTSVGVPGADRQAPDPTTAP